MFSATQKRIFATGVFLAVLLIGSTTSTAKLFSQTVHLIICADVRGMEGTSSDAVWRKNVALDARNVENTFRAQIPEKNLNIIAIEATQVTGEKVLATIADMEKLGKGMPVERADTIVFYYSGHGEHKGERGQVFQIRNSKGEMNEDDFLQRAAVRQALLEKKAKLVVMLTDCCNDFQDIKEPGKQPLPPRAKSAQNFSNLMTCLFVNPKGIQNVTSSKVRESSWFDETDKERGSLFSASLCALMAREKDNQQMTWPSFCDMLSGDVASMFRESFPKGAKKGDGGVQSNQTPHTFEMAAEQEGQRPAFGVRTTTVSDGVLIMEVLSGSPGENAGLKKGDILLTINGKEVADEHVYGQLIDESESEMKVEYSRSGARANATVKLGVWSN
ncbi:MAG: PDZ domain-containing protein [Planctomycetia bacterium]|nr:PDZ domain-containing protein [Planctomycetia bacterium]